jgi:predicted MFS family arabinose efflux permease
MIWAAPRYLPETTLRPGRLDLPGALTSTLGMTALVYGIVRAATAGWGSPLTVAALAIGTVLLMLLVINERRAREPIMPLRLFASRERAGAYAARILFLGAMLGFWFFITQYLQEVRGYSPVQAGVAFLPMTTANFAVAVAVPGLTRKIGNPRLLAAGIAVTLIGMAWLSRLSADSSYVTGIALPMIAIGAGQGGALGPLTASGIAGVAPEDAGAASGLVNVAHQLGGSLGLGILVTVFAAAGSTTLGGRALFAHRVGASLTAGTAMLALALVVVITLIVRPASNGREAVTSTDRSQSPAKTASSTRLRHSHLEHVKAR